MISFTCAIELSPIKTEHNTINLKKNYKIHTYYVCFRINCKGLSFYSFYYENFVAFVFIFELNQTGGKRINQIDSQIT